jgi:hypothetical protein
MYLMEVASIRLKVFFFILNSHCKVAIVRFYFSKRLLGMVSRQLQNSWQEAIEITILLVILNVSI